MIKLPLIVLLISLLSSCAASRYQKIHEDAFLVDTHNDLLTSVTLEGLSIEDDLSGRAHSDLARMKRGGVDLQVFSIFCDETFGKGEAYKRAVREIDSITAIASRNPSKIRLVKSFEEINLRAPYIQALSGVEGGHMMEDDLSKLDSFYNRGVRYMTLTWNNSTSWATSAKDETSGELDGRKPGLTDFGEEVVKKMNELGMIVDVSHVGEKTFWDVIRVTRKPIIASHSSVYNICPVPRNLKDDQIRAIAKNGGVIHVNFYSGFLDSTYRQKVAAFHKRHSAERDSMLARNQPSYDVSAALARMFPDEAAAIRPEFSIIIDHINYLVKVAGVDHVGIGSDFDGIDSTPKLLDGVEDFPRITRALLKEGYSRADIKKILGENFLRVLRQQ